MTLTKSLFRQFQNVSKNISNCHVLPWVYFVRISFIEMSLCNNDFLNYKIKAHQFFALQGKFIVNTIQNNVEFINHHDPSLVHKETWWVGFLSLWGTPMPQIVTNFRRNPSDSYCISDYNLVNVFNSLLYLHHSIRKVRFLSKNSIIPNPKLFTSFHPKSL